MQNILRVPAPTAPQDLVPSATPTSLSAPTSEQPGWWKPWVRGLREDTLLRGMKAHLAPVP